MLLAPKNIALHYPNEDLCNLKVAVESSQLLEDNGFVLPDFRILAIGAFVLLDGIARAEVRILGTDSLYQLT